MQAVAIIPARYASSRLPGKALLDIAGKPMIQHTYEQVQRAERVSRILVATDDDRIAQAVGRFGGEAVMTSPDHPTGTDRLAEVAATLTDELIVNVQGDEPLIHPEMIDTVIRLLVDEPTLPMSTLRIRIETPEDIFNPAITKVVTDLDGYALYFSKGPIPFCRNEWGDFVRRGETLPAFVPPQVACHVGLYAYRRDFLLRYAKLPPTPLEQLEQLEQLRVLEHGYRIKVADTIHKSIGVDTPEDLERARRIFH